LAFGRDKMLERADVARVAAYVQSLSQPEVALEPDARTAGAQIFADNCAGCHGEDARGTAELGAPDLTDGFWIYGGDTESIRASVHGGRQGQMPAWEGKLSEAERKVLALYILDLRAQRQ